MRRLMRPAVLLFLLAVVTLPAAADKAKDLYKKGQDAEARQNFEAAFDLYKLAYDLKPRDLRYRAALRGRGFERQVSLVTAGRNSGQRVRWTKATTSFRKHWGS